MLSWIWSLRLNSKWLSPRYYLSTDAIFPRWFYSDITSLRWFDWQECAAWMQCNIAIVQVVLFHCIFVLAASCVHLPCNREMPSLLQSASYIFCFHGLMCGPFCFYKDYIAFIDGTNYVSRPAQVCLVTVISDSTGPILDPWNSIILVLNIILHCLKKLHNFFLR